MSNQTPPTPSRDALKQALGSLYSSAAELERAVNALTPSAVPANGPAVGFAQHVVEGVDLDLQRAERCGFPEVIYGEGKPLSMIISILEAQENAGQDSLVTRVAPEYVDTIQLHFRDAVSNPVARTIRRHSDGENRESRGGPVFVVTAGSTDRHVAEEALETLRWMKVECELIQDVGVAGPHRLLRHVSRLQTAAAIVCVAGMEAALPSVLGGYVACPVIGVPTSVGYGASFGGITAMLAMLTCCASNVVCVNIDAGFKGGYVAGLMASRMKR